MNFYIFSKGFLFGLGDFITQFFIQKNDKYDSYRTKKMTLFGFLFAAPVLHVWYSHLLPKCANMIFSYGLFKPYNTPNKNTLCGVFLDQTAFASFFLVNFFMIMDYVDTRDAKNSWKNLKEKFWPTLLLNWTIWPAAQLINLSFIPIPYRVLYVNSLGLFWNCYLSYAQYKDEIK